jgi:phospholipid/cholesterol/gamma-HCH transport system ATP-binding protein
VASAVIELQNVGLSFEGENVLSNVSLRIEKGRSYVLVGPSGTGKTVILKIMGGILPPTEGKVLVDGHDLYKLHDQDRAKIMRKMGMLFQKNALFDSLTCGENIAFPLRETTTLGDSAILDRVNYFLDAVGLSHAINLYPDEISGGMQKRLGIARALALDPEIIFYDDPTAGLDPITSRKIIDLIKDLQKKRGATVVAITNEMNRAYQMADVVGLVVGKSITITGNPAETRAHTDPRVKQFINGELTGPLTKDQT